MDSCISVSFWHRILGNCDCDAGTDGGADGGQKPGHGAGQSDGSKGGRADEVSDDHAVSEVVQTAAGLPP